MNELPLDPRMEYEHAQRQLHSAKEMGLLPEISRQEVAFVTYVRQGLPFNTAARCAGMTAEHMMAFTDDARFHAAMQYSMERATSVLNVTRDMLNYMLMEAHACSANATEQIMAIRELGKLNDLYPRTGTPAKGAVIEHNTPSSGRALQQMDDAQLLEHAGYESLEPERPIRD